MTKTVKVLHITTHNEECGIAKYQEQFLECLRKIHGTEHAVFEYSPNRTKVMSAAEFDPVLKQFSEQMRDYDILHVQHEFSFYSKDELDKIVNEAKRLGKKVIITVHTSLHAGIPKHGYKKLAKAHVRQFLGSVKLKRYLLNVHVLPMKKADLILVHNSVTEGSLVKYGVPKHIIQRITMPVPTIDFKIKTAEITQKLHKQKGDIVYCTVGFLSENKGMRDAIQALTKLPDNYKLAMIGGAHPSGANDAFCKEMQQLIAELGLEKRAYISGYVKEDDRLNALIRECEICVYPFDKKYYAGVTSASLNNSLANFVPAITFPTKPILEMNQEMSAVITCDDFTYTDLVKEIRAIDLPKQTAIAKKYAEKFAYQKQAQKIAVIYQDLAIAR